MAIATPKVSLHLYLNNPYGLLSATIPNYEIYTPDKVPTTSPSPNGGVISPNKYPTPLPGIQETPEVEGHDKGDDKGQGMVNVGSKVRFDQDHKDSESSVMAAKHGSSLKTGFTKIAPSEHEASTIQRSKSTSRLSCDTNNSVESSPRLGFTWSINVDKDKRRRKLMLPRPPPESLLLKLGRHRNIEPVGIVKIKRPNYLYAHASSYHVQKLALNDKGQRRVSEKLAEWLDQYNEVSLKQQEYLKKIQTLRRSLQATNDKRVTFPIGKVRVSPGLKEEAEMTKHRRKYPVYTMTRLEDSVINNGPSPFPNRPVIVHTDDKQQKPTVKLVPNTTPRKLAPIVKKIKTPRGTISSNGVSQSPTVSNPSPRPEMMKMTTEYEPFESIARRNRLNLHQFLNPSIAIGQKSIGRRMPVPMSTVKIINEVAQAHSDVHNTPSPTEMSSPPLQKKTKAMENHAI